MKKHIQHQFLTLLFLAASLTTFAQIGINTTTPEGALDVVSTNSGMVFPRVANTAAVTSPVNGMMVYDLSIFCLKGFQDGEWSDCLGTRTSASVLAQLGLEADDPDVLNSVVTVDNLLLIEPEVIGLISSKETDYQNYIDGNPNLFSSPATKAEIQAMIDAIIETDVVSTTGKIWMDRNLGATQVATSITDADAYGDLYQWGRNADGHQLRTSATTAGPVTAGSEGSDFITTTTSNWLIVQDDTRWNGDTKGAEDPCPSGYRVPTETEWNAELSLFASNDADGAFGLLKLPLAGYRNSSTGAVTTPGGAAYWSSTVNGTNARQLDINSIFAGLGDGNRGFGFSVRCIKEAAPVIPTTTVAGAGGTTLTFMSHNLGADLNLDPHAPVLGLQGAYIQWGQRGPNISGNASVDWQTAPNDGPLGFAAAPTATDDNAGSITNWNTTAAIVGAWNSGTEAAPVKTVDDPCPTGYRVPTNNEWIALHNNNTVSRTGAFTSGSTNYVSALHYGPDAATKQLTLPATGYRTFGNGTLKDRGNNGAYWTSTENGSSAYSLGFTSSNVTPDSSGNFTSGFSVRCIAE